MGKLSKHAIFGGEKLHPLRGALSGVRCRDRRLSLRTPVGWAEGVKQSPAMVG
jgi:hypothetical protein